MEPANALFPGLLGDAAWRELPIAVQRMHGAAARIVAHGEADVEGDSNIVLRIIRRILGLPSPGLCQMLEFSIERNGTREIWTRCFAHGQMQSTLHRHAGSPYLREQLGPVTLHFTLRNDACGIDWTLHRVTLLGIPVPRAWFGSVLSRSYADDDRYTFAIDTRLPLAGRLIAYRGWLEIVADE